MQALTIGILECDHVDKSFRHIAGDYADMFETLFAQHAPALRLKRYDVIGGQLPASLNECAGYIGTGSRWSVYDDQPWIGRFRALVQDLYNEGHKYVGICFSHQMIAEALDGRCIKAPGGWGLGIQTLEVISPAAWMTPVLSQAELNFSHQDQVTQLPTNSTLLAASGHCPYAMFTVGDHFLGLQAHPEIPPAYIEALIEARAVQFDPAVVSRARATFQKQTHEAIMAQWIENFLRT